jgi:5-enolpyruvylshikimate-3-phosphate synthase
LQLLFEQGDIRAQWDARERAALVGCSWDEEHTPDEVMSLAIFAANAGRPAGGFVHRYDARYSPGERR